MQSIITSVLVLFAANQPLPAEQVTVADKYNLAAEYRELKNKQQEKQCLTAALFHEAKGEGLVGIKAVASVIENRKHNADYPGTYCKIIKQHRQFSFVLEGKPIHKLEQQVKPSEKEVFALVSRVAEQVLEGRFKPTLPAKVLHYTTHAVRNQWTAKMQVVAKIGNHRFYVK
jgi:spore germination cell wall hydrolase CwlJ-like protein